MRSTFLLFLQRMIAKTVKIVRGCRSQPYSMSSFKTCSADKDISPVLKKKADMIQTDMNMGYVA